MLFAAFLYGTCLQFVVIPSILQYMFAQFSTLWRYFVNMPRKAMSKASIAILLATNYNTIE